MKPARLERSCTSPAGGWIVSEAAAGGVARLHARLDREAYTRHRHDTYTVALTESGIQEFNYLGAVHRSRPGQVVVLHPDELHDGRPGTPEGFAYRALYLEPSRVHDAARAISGARCSLPFVRDPVVTDPVLAARVAEAFEGIAEPLDADAAIVAIAQRLVAHAQALPRGAAARPLDVDALQRAREFLGSNWARVVRAEELEQVSGLSRFELCAQFKRRYGTSPYRFMVMRRLEHVQARLADGSGLAEIAAEAGFADQSHMTRVFKARLGLTPHRYRALQLAALSPAA